MVHVLSLVNCLDKVKILKKCNCKELFIGIESGSDVIRKRINKMGSTSDIIKVISKILECGIDVKGYFMYGFPDEEKEHMKETYDLAREIKKISQKYVGMFRPSVFQFRPYHGTKLYNDMVQNGIEIPNCFYNASVYTSEGRSQFNFSSGNYSKVSDKMLEEYIIKTQKIMEA